MGSARAKERYDRKSTSFYSALAKIYRREANSLEQSAERYAGKAATVRALRAQADYHEKMAGYQVAVGIKRTWIKDYEIYEA